MLSDRFSSLTTCSRWRHETEPGQLDQSLSCRFWKVATHPFLELLEEGGRRALSKTRSITAMCGRTPREGRRGHDDQQGHQQAGHGRVRGTKAPQHAGKIRAPPRRAPGAENMDNRTHTLLAVTLARTRAGARARLGRSARLRLERSRYRHRHRARRQGRPRPPSRR